MAEPFPSCPYLNVARQTGADYGTVLAIADALEQGKSWTDLLGGITCCDKSVLLFKIEVARRREQRRRELVLSEAGTA